MSMGPIPDVGQKSEFFQLYQGDNGIYTVCSIMHPVSPPVVKHMNISAGK